MTLQEFTDRMNGNAVEQEVFDNKIHPIYMMTNLDKDTFCDDWRLHGTSRILADVAAEALAQKKAAENIQAVHDKYVETTCRDRCLTAEKLLIIADDCASREAYELAVALAGQSFCTSFKVKQDLELNKQDKDYILSHLA